MFSFLKTKKTPMQAREMTEEEMIRMARNSSARTKKINNSDDTFYRAHVNMTFPTVPTHKPIIKKGGKTIKNKNKSIKSKSKSMKSKSKSMKSKSKSMKSKSKSMKSKSKTAK